jgi:hypothetical protein
MYGVNLEKVTIQTDNGCEFVGSWLSKAPSGFSQICESHFAMRHRRIPPHQPTFNSDVEAFHSRVEEEFYDIESFSTTEELLAKAYDYIIYFNCQRANYYKNKKTPLYILRETDQKINANVLVFAPLILDKFIPTLRPTRGGYYLPSLDKLPQESPLNLFGNFAFGYYNLIQNYGKDFRKAQSSSKRGGFTYRGTLISLGWSGLCATNRLVFGV